MAVKPLVGLLLVISGAILAIQPVYEVLAYLDYRGWPVVQGILGVACIVIGLVLLMQKGGKSEKKAWVEVG